MIDLQRQMGGSRSQQCHDLVFLEIFPFPWNLRKYIFLQALKLLQQQEPFPWARVIPRVLLQHMDAISGVQS